MLKAGILSNKNGQWSDDSLTAAERAACTLVLVFGNRILLQQTPNPFLKDLRSMYPKADLVVASSAGEICNGNKEENTITAAALIMQKTTIRVTCRNVKETAGNSVKLGALVAGDLKGDKLRSVILFADGYHINGDDLVEDLAAILGKEVQITGGLAGDDTRFQMTLVGVNEELAEGNVVAVGFYGDHFKTDVGINRGWDLFGPERTITRSDKHILYEIDNMCALDLYKKYLGKYADELPGSALLFPLCITAPDGKNSLVRTVLSVDEKAGTMQFAGNMPQGAKLRFMKANLDQLILGSENVEGQLREGGFDSSQFSLVVSCVGRKIVLSERIEEELDSLSDIIRSSSNMLGYFSYGEIGPAMDKTKCYLHNQTTIVTTFTEF